MSNTIYNFKIKEKTGLFFCFFVTLILCIFQHNSVWAVSLSDLPNKILLSGVDEPYPTSDLFNKTPVLIVVGSHSTTPLFTEVPYTWKARNLPIMPKQFLSIAAVHKAPWFVKIFLRGNIQSAKEKRDEQSQKYITNLEQSSIIVDLDGKTSKALGVANLTKNEYAAFVLNDEKHIKLLVRAKIATKSGDEHEFQKAAEHILNKAQVFFKE
jgi:hypothetical protein